MSFIEIISIAWSNIKANILRALLTLMIIAVGIAALVGILTAIDTAIYALSDNFSSLGSNSYSINRKWMDTGVIIRGRMQKKSTPISFKQATTFKEKFDLNGLVSISTGSVGGLKAKYKNEETNPVLYLIGADENNIFAYGDEVIHGRYFNRKESEEGDQKAVIGYFIAKSLFNNKPENAVGKTISINSLKYKVIGVIEEKGSSLNQSNDKKILVPLMLAKRAYMTDRSNYKITVSMNNPEQMTRLISETIGTMRTVRGLRASEENNFEIRKSDGIIEDIKENTLRLRLAAILIGIITLIGAAIGLMNIMLVSVTERTKEIGIIKAIGATRETVVRQFLVEAILICQFGGLLGVLFGLGIGFGVSQIFGSPFIMPWAWIVLGLTMCTIVGLLSGLYPAYKASRLDPIESLRYE